MADGTLRLTVDIPPYDAQDAFRLFGAPDTPVGLARLTNDAAKELMQDQLVKETTAQAPKAGTEKPYGKYATQLYAGNFFRNRRVLEAIGTDAQYLDWLKTRQCCVRKMGGCFGDIVPAHVRRVANGAGTGVKPEYSAVPMCDAHHKLQHQKGESAVGSKELMDDKRWYYLIEWAKTRLANSFGQESMGWVRPEALVEWAIGNGVEDLLPEAYRVLAYS